MPGALIAEQAGAACSGSSSADMNPENSHSKQGIVSTHNPACKGFTLKPERQRNGRSGALISDRIRSSFDAAAADRARISAEDPEQIQTGTGQSCTARQLIGADARRWNRRRIRPRIPDTVRSSGRPYCQKGETT